MNERIKQIRKDAGLTQEKFAERIGLKQNSIALIESGKRTPSEQTVLSICREFKVRQEWLRTGDGDPYKEALPDKKLAAFIGDISDGDSDDFRRRFMEMLAGLDPADWELLERMAEKLTQKKEENP
nr:MAG TPA: Repressor protein CI [Caudoviricetes sp.]DAZ55459.1 MAG TPA: Repressor protein CI [Caudoviricetes sp.]